jgi:hypothetical protein
MHEYEIAHIHGCHGQVSDLFKAEGTPCIVFMIESTGYGDNTYRLSIASPGRYSVDGTHPRMLNIGQNHDDENVLLSP